jgi:hypothetical protein
MSFTRRYGTFRDAGSGTWPPRCRSRAKQRMRDRVAQTALFIQDPIGSLPHYSLWDMNRGFGP